GEVQICLGVPVADIPVVVRVQKDAPADKLGIEVVPSGLMNIPLAPLEGDEKHRRQTGELGPHVIPVDDGADFLQKTAAFLPYVVEDRALLQDLDSFQRGNVAVAVRKKGGRYEKVAPPQ